MNPDLRGADTPEMHTDTLEAGRAAKARAAELLLERHALMRTHKGERSFDPVHRRRVDPGARVERVRG